LLARYKRFILESAQTVVVPTAASAEFVSGLSGKRFDIVLAPNPVDAARLDAQPSPEQGSRLIFVGDLSARKGFDLFLEACRLGAERGWTGVAWGRDSEDLATTAPDNCRVVVGGSTLEEIRRELNVADIWCIPSRSDPAPLTFSEALAYGIRVCISDGVAYSKGDAFAWPGVAAHAAGDSADLLRVATELLAQPRPPLEASYVVSVDAWADKVLRSLFSEEGHRC
jgi:glycosyltransferase involved in cell wall biosynthesis